MRNKKVKVVLALTTLAMSVALSACGHEHEWKEATCTTPKICVTCEKTEGEALGHEWEEATCTEPKTCVTCGETEGEALGHEWKEATCTEPKTCVTCGETEGEALGHVWSEATCIEPKTCATCGEIEGELAEHDLNDTGKCYVCGKQIGYALNSSNYKQYLNITFDIEKIDSPYDKWDGNKLTVNVEPVKNVDFENVRVDYECTEYLSSYWLINGKAVEDQIRSGSVSIDSAGYGSSSISSMFWIKGEKFIGISGYVIE